ncbi:carotenoid oxygenase [Nocardia brasiliensis]|uniref:Dioxygenase n=1 Tax=Nocardia brasiliensis TaxID=37326 RepID=A0A6G9XTK2_NOCBR|nr:carotenoid oxygenase family protein [Nocardia brasiliensis]QIS04282.1 carotenoid oxygenase [Nocardia brasiliensis]
MSSVIDARTADTQRVFEPAQETPAEITLPVTGTIPQELRGTLYRNGPARWEAGGFRAGHPFDGDGLVSKFVIDAGQIRFRSRYVRTPKYLAAQDGRGARVRGLYSQARGLTNPGRPPADSANTHAVPHGQRLLALSDAGRPWELDPEDLRTHGPCDFDGQLPRLSRFSPHPKIDPVTGELFNFGLDIALGHKVPAGLRCYRVDPQGRMHRAGLVRLDAALIQHDFAITERYLVFALAPITVDPARAALAALGIGTYGDSADYRPERGMRIVLVPRDGSEQRVIECDPFVYIHVDNAYDDGTDVVLDVVRYDAFDFISTGLKNFRSGLPGFGVPTRVRITRSGRVTREDIGELASLEFPMHDDRRTGRTHRFSYYAAHHPDRDAALVKYDHQTGTERRHTFTDGEFPGEPVFVPRATKAAEDEGWILSVTYLAAEHRTALIILDARNLEAPPLATARLDHHIFPGFHGSFTPEVTTRK